MRFKGLLLDMDDTIYDYQTTHQSAIHHVFLFCEKEMGIKKENAIDAFDMARKKVHNELSETAASHNRLLYFQKMLEILGYNPLRYSVEMYHVYWDYFIEKMNPFDGIYDVLEKYKNRICLVTDLTAYIQYRKVEKLRLPTYCNHIVTSEEVGREKPHPLMFIKAVQKLNLQPNEVCMIGDNFHKDILGACHLGIKSIWLNHTRKVRDYDTDLVTEVNRVQDIMNVI